MLWHKLIGAGGTGETYSTFTVIYLGTAVPTTNPAIVTGFGLDAPQADRQIVAIMSTNNSNAGSYTCTVGGVSLTRVVSKNGPTSSAPGVAIFLGSVPNGSTGTVQLSTDGVAGLYAVYKAETTASATATSTGSTKSATTYSIASGGGAVFAGVGFRNSASSLERRGIGGENANASGTVSITYAQSNATALYGGVTQRYNQFIGNTGDTNAPVSAAMALDSL